MAKKKEEMKEEENKETKGNKKAEDVLSIIDSKNRTKAGMTAPAKGLTLLEIYY